MICSSSFWQAFCCASSGNLCASGRRREGTYSPKLFFSPPTWCDAARLVKAVTTTTPQQLFASVTRRAQLGGPGRRLDHSLLRFPGMVFAGFLKLFVWTSAWLPPRKGYNPSMITSIQSQIAGQRLRYEKPEQNMSDEWEKRQTGRLWDLYF